MKTPHHVEIVFGALSPTIGDQLAQQGLAARENDIAHWEYDRKAIIRLRVRGLLSDSTANSIGQRLMKRIAVGVYREPDKALARRSVK